MKKTNTSVTKITVFFIFLLVLVVGYYAYLSGTHRTEQQEAVMSEIDTALSRNLENNYPSTPKEVVKYYNDLMKCFYNEDCTEEELQELGKKSLQLFDEELRENNEEESYPDEVIDRLARAFYPAILACWNSEEGQREFAAWQAEQAHHAPSNEKQSVPDGERPVVHIAIVCGFLQGASGWTRPVFFLENFKTSSDFGEWLP